MKLACERDLKPSFSICICHSTSTVRAVKEGDFRAFFSLRGYTSSFSENSYAFCTEGKAGWPLPCKGDQVPPGGQKFEGKGGLFPVDCIFIGSFVMALTCVTLGSRLILSTFGPKSPAGVQCFHSTSISPPPRRFFSYSLLGPTRCVVYDRVEEWS